MRKNVLLASIILGIVLTGSGLAMAMEHQEENGQENMQHDHMTTYCIMGEEHSITCISSNDEEMHEMMQENHHEMMEHIQNHQEMMHMNDNMNHE